MLAANAEAQSLSYKQQYSLAARYANSTSPTDATDALALKHYLSVIGILTNKQSDNLFLLKTYIEVGAFMQVLDRQDEAIGFFKQSFELKPKIGGLNDSILFAPYVYCGNSYFRKDKLDSAQLFYLKAKKIADKFPKVDQQERLFNTLGVIAYSTGNYNTSVSYYEKAISVLESNARLDRDLLLTYQSNLASAFRKLKRFREAFVIYKDLLHYKIETTKIYHNLGSAYLAVNKPDSAIYYFEKIKDKSAKLLNDLAAAYLLKKQPDVALNYLRLSRSLTKDKGFNSILGNNLKLTGDGWAMKKELIKAISFYQYAIRCFYPEFNPKYINQNPMHFSGVFNTIDLMETFVAKAKIQTLLYQQGRKVAHLDGALNTYQAFYNLADQVTRFYDNDEARLLISDRKYTVHKNAIAVCLQLFELTHNTAYLEKAFVLDEENKASILSLSRAAVQLGASSKVSGKLLSLEDALKTRITRISISASVEADTAKLSVFKRELNDNILKLTDIQQKIRAADNHQELASHSEALSLAAFQRSIPASSAVLSYHIGNKSVLCFVITNNSFHTFSSAIDANFFAVLNRFEKLLRLKDGNHNREVMVLSQKIYRSLVKPAKANISAKHHLYIIPDDELNKIPFEVLADDEGNTVISQFSVTYNYACRLLLDENHNFDYHKAKMLGVAPFNASGSADWPALPSSPKEIARPIGMKLLGRSASKSNFLKLSSNYGLIHLATHATVDNDSPNKSYIAFYPDADVSDLEKKLYLPEIYNLKLRNTGLVILSACESGTGASVHGEGLMSLARAFSYAGCDNIITSMWNADDASTAAVLDKFHLYNAKGFAISKALQKAQLDYLSDDNISPTRKTQAYWAHLRVIGSFEKDAIDQKIWIYFLMIPICIALAIISRKLFAKFREG